MAPLRWINEPRPVRNRMTRLHPFHEQVYCNQDQSYGPLFACFVFQSQGLPGIHRHLGTTTRRLGLRDGCPRGKIEAGLQSYMGPGLQKTFHQGVLARESQVGAELG